MLEVAEINRAIGAEGVLPAECRELVRALHPDQGLSAGINSGG